METTFDQPTLGDERSLREVYLSRLERLMTLRARHADELNSQGLRLLDRSLFEAYTACREMGATREAQAIINRTGFPAEGPARRAGAA
jgi:hypothetical protein